MEVVKSIPIKMMVPHSDRVGMASGCEDAGWPGQSVMIDVDSNILPRTYINAGTCMN